MVEILEMKTLYPYQQKAVNELRDGFRKYVGQILQSPTGSGKTVMFSEIVRLSQIKRSNVLILTDRKELFRQISDTLQSVGVVPKLINAQTKSINDISGVFVCMVETLARRESILFDLKPDLIIIDEAHKGNFTKIIEFFYDVRRIGATATPLGKHIPDFYESIVNTLDVHELVAAGFLCRCRHFQMQDDFSDLKKRAGEYTEQSQFAHFNKKKMYDGVIENYLDRYSGKKTICFNINIEHTRIMHDAFVSAGIRSEMITSKTSTQDRERILQEFHEWSGQFVLNNCGVLTTGYDEPSIECVILNRATDSLALYLQMVGRGSRRFPGKDEFGVLDFGGNIIRHGLWSQPREWSLEQAKKRKSDKLDVMPIKTCVKCSAMIPIMSTKCEFCGHEYDMTNKKLKDGVLVEIEEDTITGKMLSELTVPELYKLSQQKREGYSSALIWRVVRNIGENAVWEYAKLAGYSHGWIARQLGDLKKKNEYRDKKIV